MLHKRVTSASSFFKPWFFLVVLILILSENVTADWQLEQSIWGLGPLVKKNERATVISTEDGDVSEARVTDGNEAFQLHFITLAPNSLFLPVLLHWDMVFYVQTGSGRLSYIDEDVKEERRLTRGDIHRLRSGAVFFIQSDLEDERQNLRIIAIFDNSEYDFNDPAAGPYSSISDLVLGFDDGVLSTIFKVSEQVIAEIRSGTRPAAIVHRLQKKENTIRVTKYEFMEDMYNILNFSNKHKLKHKKSKSKLFNIFGEDPDFKNCNGWSTTVNQKKYGPLRGSKYGIFMVNLTIGSMMGPHWNPMATEIAVVLQGKGMVHVVCSRMVNVSGCKNSRYFVEEGDVFVIPKFHPMAQMAFNNETFVFMGFSTSIRKNHPQYASGKYSVIRTLDKHITAASFGTNVSTFDKLLAKQDDAVILGCISCAEEEWMRMVEEIEKERQREKEREEEAARKKEEEEAEKEREEEEDEREREEQEEREREEKERQEQQKKREEEEERKRQEQEEKEREEQQEREREEKERQEQQKKREEEEERKRQEQEEKEREEQEREREEKERQEQQKRWEEEERKRQEQEERERQEQQKQEQKEREAKEREEEREAEREREEQARREEEAAKEEEEAHAEGQEQPGEGQGEQVPEDERGQEADARREEEATRREAAAQRWEEHRRGQQETGQSSQESAEAQEEQGGGPGWARRILKKTA